MLAAEEETYLLGLPVAPDVAVRLNRDHADMPAVLGGDFNAVPTDFDIHSLRSFADNALVQPAPRATFAQLIDMGWTDAIRTLHPDEPMLTFWSYLRNRWPCDAGLRLDHLLLSPAVALRLKSSAVDRDIRGEPSASDHAPAWIRLSSEFVNIRHLLTTDDADDSSFETR